MTNVNNIDAYLRALFAGPDWGPPAPTPLDVHRQATMRQIRQTEMRRRNYKGPLTRNEQAALAARRAAKRSAR